MSGIGFAFEPTPVMAGLRVGKAGIRNLVFSPDADLKDSGVQAATVTISGDVGRGAALDPCLIAEAYWTMPAQPSASS